MTVVPKEPHPIDCGSLVSTAEQLVKEAILAIVALIGNMSGCTETGEHSEIQTAIGQLKQSVAAHESRIAEIERALKSGTGKGLSLEADSKESPTEPAPPQKPATPDKTSLIDVTVTNKRLDPRDVDARQYDDYIWYDATYISRLKKQTRSV